MSDTILNKIPQSLKKGDLIYITAPAKAIDADKVNFAKDLFESRGFKVLISEHCTGQNNYFSGTDEERTRDFQTGIDNPDVKAIMCARGGYGCIRILDRIQWASQLRDPKFIIGFSDVTVFHHRMQRFGIPSIHGTMPLNFEENSKEAIDTLVNALTGQVYDINWKSVSSNKQGQSSGKLVGGNLSVLYGLLGTDDHIDYSNCILFIEDLCEPLYAIDRMMYALSKAGVLDKINGLIIGGMTELKDSDPSFGATLEEIILEKFMFRNIPIAFNCPAGHINDNRAMVFGDEVNFSVNPEEAIVSFTRTEANILG